MRTRTAEWKLGNGGTLTDAISEPIPVGESWHHIFYIRILEDGTTVKFRGSIQDQEQSSGLNELAGVDFQQAQSVSNRWDYVRTYNINTGAYVAGSTGLVGDTGDIFLVELNINALEMVAVEVDGSANCSFRGYSTGK